VVDVYTAAKTIERVATPPSRHIRLAHAPGSCIRWVAVLHLGQVQEGGIFPVVW
jgi:hypothetical protein